MKRTIALCIGLLSFALLPALAQTPVQTPAQAPETNAVIKIIIADMKAAAQDFSDADNARVTAIQTLGATASNADLDAKEAEIRTAKYTEIETLMLKDTAAKPDASILWVELAQAQLGLKKYDLAEATYKKVLAIEAAAKKPNAGIQGSANAALGEIYARTGKVADANAAFDAAAKADPTRAAIILVNESKIFSQVRNADAQAAAADEAIKVDPKLAIAYYLKAQGLIGKATYDTRTQLYTLPPGCAKAYRMYLQLAPNGAYADDVKGILAKSTQQAITSKGGKTK